MLTTRNFNCLRYWERAYNVQPPLSKRPRGHHWNELFCWLSDVVVEPLTFVACFDIGLDILLHGEPIVSSPNKLVYQ